MTLIRMTRRPAPFTRPFMDELPDRIRQMFEGTLSLDPVEPMGWMPAIDLVERDNLLVLTAELPGLEEKNVDISCEDGVLTIRGEKRSERKEGEDDRYQVVERTYGTFVRTFQLPQGVNEDLIKGEFENGVLSVSIPKAALPQPKRIQIGGSQHKEQATVGAGNVSNQQSTGKTSGKNSTTTSQRERDSEKMAASGR